MPFVEVFAKRGSLTDRQRAHITDNLVGGIANTGRQVNELITKLAKLDSLPKQLLGRDQKDEDRTLHVMPQSETMPDRPASSEHLDEADVFFAHRGQFEVTVSDGPNYQSQREEASAFSDTLLQTLPSMGLPPQIIHAKDQRSEKSVAEARHPLASKDINSCNIRCVGYLLTTRFLAFFR